MAKSGTLTVKVVGDASGFKRTMDDVQGKLGKVAGGVAQAGKLAAVGTAAAGAGAIALGQEVLNTGAKLTAWRQKTNTVFEDQAADVRAWADKNNETFGLTDDELSGLAAGFGDLLKPMGFTSGQAAAMSKDVIGLSGALSEWSGGTKSAAEVSEVLAKAMLGERDGLKELGISISEADVQARLALKGQDKLTGAALEQAKALATQELIFEKSTDAQKAFAEGGNKALRAQNNLKAGLSELREQVADRLLPIVTKITQWLADNLPGALDKAGKIAGDLKRRWDQVFPAVQQVVERFGAVVSTVVDTITGLFRRSEGDVGGSASKLSEIVAKLGEAFQKWFDAIKVAVETFVKVATELWDRFGSYLIDYAKRTFDNVMKVVSGALDVITGVLDIFIGLFTGDWSRMWDGIKSVVSGAWAVITGVVSQGFNAIRLLFDGARAALSAAWSLIWNGLTTFATDAFNGLVGYVSRLPARIAAAASGMWDGIKDSFRSAVNWIIRKWNGLEFTIGGGKIFGKELPSTTLSTPNIPEFHTGGIFSAPGGRGEGLALLKSGEGVFTPGQMRAMGGVGDSAVVAELRALRSDVRNMQLVVDGRVIGDVVRNEGSMYALRNG